MAAVELLDCRPIARLSYPSIESASADRRMVAVGQLGVFQDERYRPRVLFSCLAAVGGLFADFGGLL